jgi:hypothetical protein
MMGGVGACAALVPLSNPDRNPWIGQAPCQDGWCGRLRRPGAPLMPLSSPSYLDHGRTNE